jgi:hypothetical protein
MFAVCKRMALEAFLAFGGIGKIYFLQSCKPVLTSLQIQNPFYGDF